MRILRLKQQCITKTQIRGFSGMELLVVMMILAMLIFMFQQALESDFSWLQSMQSIHHQESFWLP